MGDPAEETFSCRVCGGECASEARFASFAMVGSDASIARASSAIGQCRSCGHVQKPVTDAWSAEVARIYAAYDMTQSIDGVVQQMYEGPAGAPVARVDAIAERVLAMLPTDRPAVLDVGTGNGDFVRSLTAGRAGLQADVLEASARYRDGLLASGVVREFHLDRGGVEGPYDAITLLHVLEHVPDPAAFLADLAPLLRGDGFMWVQVPNTAVATNDLLVFDHCSHFAAAALADVVTRSGLVLAGLESAAGGRELSALIRRAGDPVAPAPGAPILRLPRALEELRRFRDAVRGADRDPWVFGVGNMGAWIAAERDGRLAGYVDDDPVKWGRTFQGRPIVAPSDGCIDGGLLCIPLWGERAAGVATRMDAAGRGIRTVSP
jgi:hypothetical protein